MFGIDCGGHGISNDNQGNALVNAYSSRSGLRPGQNPQAMSLARCKSGSSRRGSSKITLAGVRIGSVRLRTTFLLELILGFFFARAAGIIAASLLSGATGFLPLVSLLFVRCR